MPFSYSSGQVAGGIFAGVVVAVPLITSIFRLSRLLPTLSMLLLASLFGPGVALWSGVNQLVWLDDDFLFAACVGLFALYGFLLAYPRHHRWIIAAVIPLHVIAAVFGYRALN